MPESEPTSKLTGVVVCEDLPIVLRERVNSWPRSRRGKALSHLLFTDAGVIGLCRGGGFRPLRFPDWYQNPDPTLADDLEAWWAPKGLRPLELSDVWPEIARILTETIRGEPVRIAGSIAPEIRARWPKRLSIACARPRPTRTIRLRRPARRKRPARARSPGRLAKDAEPEKLGAHRPERRWAA